jgi:hypothetical protein
MAKSTASLAAKYVFKDFFGGMLYFPFWWYTRGLVTMFNWVKSTIRYGYRSMALGVWVKNWLVPMYGESSWQGRVVSFFVRTGVIFARAVGVFAWALAAFLGLFIYVIALPLAFVGALYHFVGIIIG